MTIPRTDQPRLRMANGVWTVRKQMGGKRFERSLGTANRSIAEERARIILDALVRSHVSETWAEEVAEAATASTGWLWRLWNRASCRRKESSLRLEELKQIALRSGGYCEVSGIRFTLKRRLHPCQPSLDRLNGANGYSLENCRLVALAVNYCMGPWGESMFTALSLSMARRHLERIEKENGLDVWRGAYAETDKGGPAKPMPQWLMDKKI